jgi:hypothetical protein
VSRRLSLLLVLNGAILALAGAVLPPQPPGGAGPAGLKRVTLHVKDMASRQDLF